MATLSHRDAQPESSLLWGAIDRAFALVFGIGAFVHTCLAIRDPEGYRPLADAALYGWVSRDWQSSFMADPRQSALLLAAGELLIATLLLFAPRAGCAGVIAFSLTLMLFGHSFWMWSIPALLFAVPAAFHEQHSVRATP